MHVLTHSSMSGEKGEFTSLAPEGRRWGPVGTLTVFTSHFRNV